VCATRAHARSRRGGEGVSEVNEVSIRRKPGAPPTYLADAGRGMAVADRRRSRASSRGLCPRWRAARAAWSCTFSRDRRASPRPRTASKASGACCSTPARGGIARRRVLTGRTWVAAQLPDAAQLPPCSLVFCHAVAAWLRPRRQRSRAGINFAEVERLPACGACIHLISHP
jgi:hypothetical protein